MIDATAEDEFALRLPAVYSQGFAQVRVMGSKVDLYSPGPLAVPEDRERAAEACMAAAAARANDVTALKPVA